jgi:hypothetical protein
MMQAFLETYLRPASEKRGPAFSPTASVIFDTHFRKEFITFDTSGLV